METSSKKREVDSKIQKIEISIKDKFMKVDLSNISNSEVVYLLELVKYGLLKNDLHELAHLKRESDNDS